MNWGCDVNAVIQFPTGRIRTKLKEVRVADLDDGYTRIANELYEALIGADLTKHQLKVVLAVLRKTYGFNQTHDRISNGQLAEMTGLPETRYPVTEAFASQMQSLYPAVNVAQELRAMCGWLLANPTKRKTKTGITRFINSWLAKCQDRGGQNGLAGYAPRGGHTDLTQTMTADELNRRLQEGF
ncbi:UNVERIFIED_CONTAM: hypothetical protein K2H54_000268 [Gekko kuhli]